MITYKRASEMVKDALEAAEQQNLRLSVAVMDGAGNLVAFGRSDQAPPYTTEVALGKAFGAAYMRRPSSEIAALADARPQFFAALMSLGKHHLIPSPGGLLFNGGAIGVSGAPDPAIDVAIAEGAIAATRIDSQDGEND